MCCAVMAHITDYDVWHTSEEPVTVMQVIEVLNRNTAYAQQAVQHLIRELTPRGDCECNRPGFRTHYQPGGSPG